jgi:predicted XRE-type DNA-binding protein
VLHAFEKRTRQARRADLDLARRRYAAVLVDRLKERSRSVPTRVRSSKRNVFLELGFGAKEAEHLRIRSDLMIVITRLIESCGLTQTQAASAFGVSQPRISDLVRGKIERFSVDTLIEMLGHAGTRVDIVVKRRGRAA